MARILIVEDDEGCRLLAGEVVLDLGHIPIYSADGQHAWETLEIDPTIALVVTDVMMPRMDGRELLDKMRGATRLQRIPVIVISAVVGPREISRLLEHGATRLQAKPLDMIEFRENIQAALEGAI
jgi:CheY-like chemotaxis protein